MNHLTNLYKHKCEQLQEHLNNLTRMLNEGTGTPWWRGRPRIHVDGTPGHISDLTHHHINPNSMPNVPESWNDLLSLSRSATPNNMHSLITHLNDDTGFMTWWHANYGIVRIDSGIYQRLVNGKVFEWDPNNYRWIPIDQPGTQTQFGPIGNNGIIIKIPFVDPTLPTPPTPLNKPKPPTDPPDPGTGMNPGWNSGTNN